MRKGPGPSLSNQSILAFGVSTVDFLFNDKEDLRVIGDLETRLVCENGSGAGTGNKKHLWLKLLA